MRHLFVIQGRHFIKYFACRNFIECQEIKNVSYIFVIFLHNVWKILFNESQPVVHDLKLVGRYLS